MKTIKFTLFLFLSIALCNAYSQEENHTHRKARVIDFPDIPGYKTLKTDLHIHSVFSDGDVWPSIRVHEALRDGLDAISLTEHIEYQPHSKDIPHPDRNRAFEIAFNEAKDHDLIITNGSEVTREMPPGHVNAIFISDANKLKKEDPIAIFKEAKKQGAFIFWNHPNWIAQRKDGVATLTEMHKKLIKEGLLDGIEVVNEHTYSEEALKIALDYNLTIMGTSDIHGLIDWDYKVPEGGHRPVTLVFAKENTEASLKEGLMNGRTVVWFNNTLIGKKEFLEPLLKSSIIVDKVAPVNSYKGESLVQEVILKNVSDADYILRNQSEYNFHTATDVITIKANSTYKLQVKTLKKIDDFQLKFEVLNAIAAPKKYITITLAVIVNN